MLLRWWKLRKLRPLLATLTRTDLRVDPAKLGTASVNAMSARQLVVAGAASVVAASAALTSGAIQLALHHRTGFLWLSISATFAFIAWRHFKMVVGRG